jgi:competence protein ComGD
MFNISNTIKTDINDAYYLQRLKYDLIYAQNYSMRRNDKMYIYFELSNGGYVLRNSPLSAPKIIRNGSENIKITLMSTTNPLYFTTSGAVNQAGKIEVIINGKKSVVTLYIGSGRFSVET